MPISSLISPEALTAATRHFKRTDGWLSVNAAQVFMVFHEFQRRKLGLKGHILEVGAHEARSSVFFTHLLDADETLHVSDLFDSQELNISKSAGSSFSAWKQNFSRFKLGDPNVRVHHGPSQALDPAELGSGFRIAYLDGGHATDEVRSDLELAESILIEPGVAIVDDTFNQEFPGTTEGLISYVLADSSRLVPLLCFESKVALVSKSYYETYRTMLRDVLDSDESWFLPAQQLCGYEVLTIRFYNNMVERVGNWFKHRVPALYRAFSRSDTARAIFHSARRRASRG